VVGVILELREALDEASASQRPEFAAEYLCDLFDGTAAAINLMDYGRARYQTVRNVGRLSVGEVTRPDGEFYAFADFPYTSHQLNHGGAYRSSLVDPACPPEYRQLLSAMRRTDCMGAPIRLSGRPVGEFWVTRDGGQPFTEADADVAVACGATLARYFRPEWAVAG
jgi:GAF domain-containing protein